MTTPSETLRTITDPKLRADFTLSTLSSGGELQPTAAKKFIQLAQNATPLLRECQVTQMLGKEHHIPRIVFANQILRASATDGSDVSSGNRAAPTTTEVVLTAKDYHGEVQVTYKALQDNVEYEALENTLMSMIATRVGVDMEILALNSDTDITDTDQTNLGWAQQDGWIKLITSNVVSASNAYVSSGLMENARVAVPLKYRQLRQGQFKFYVEEHAANKWRETVAARPTPGGDTALTSENLPFCGGTPVIPVGNMPVASGSPNTSKILFTDPKNLIVGIWTKLDIRTQDWPSQRKVRIFVTARLAFGVEQEFASAKITGVRAAA